MTGNTLHDNYLHIYNRMCATFRTDELEALCDRLGVDPAALFRQGGTRDTQVRDLLCWAAANRRSQDLIGQLKTLKPKEEWPADYASPPMPSPPAHLPPRSPAPLPPGSRLLYGRNPLFTGREDELARMAETLLPVTTPVVRRDEERSELVIRHSSLVTSGIGGMGKTQLAVEFAHRYGHHFAGVYWVSLANADAVPGEVAACGAAMGLVPGFYALPLPDQVALTQRAWAGPEPRLIIFDNCEDPALLAQWRPVGGGARLLVTSRNAVWPRSLGLTRLALGELSPEEAVALLEQYLGTIVARHSSLVTLAAAVGHLPLALHLAGCYLESYADDPAGTPEALLAELNDPARRLRAAALTGRGAAGSPTDHALHVANTFLLSLERLEQSPQAEMAGALLACAACLAPGEPFPAALLRAALAVPDSRDVTDGLRALEGVGLLERVEKAGEPFYRLHQLVAWFVAGAFARRDAAGEGGEGEKGIMVTAQAAVEKAVIDRAYEQNLAGDPRQLKEWDVHLRYVTNAAFGREDETNAALYANLGYYLQMSGLLAAARPYYERALAISELVFGPEHPDTAMSLNNLGSLSQVLGDLAAARQYYERALAIRERVLAPEHRDTALSLNNLGTLLQTLGDLAAARPYFERALTICEHVLGLEHPYTAISLNNLGGLLYAQGELAFARPLYERALAIYERVLGSEHPDTAISLNSLGNLLYAQRDLDAAQPYYERALAIRERILGPEHPYTAQSLNNLGTLLQAQGDLVAARPYFERALAIIEHVLGSQHPDTAMSLNNLGTLLHAQGDLAAARSCYECALATCEAKLGPNHPHTRIVRDNLATLS